MSKAYTLYHQDLPVQSSDTLVTLQRRMKRDAEVAQRSRSDLPSLYYVQELSAAVDWGNSGRSLRRWEIHQNSSDDQ